MIKSLQRVEKIDVPKPSKQCTHQLSLTPAQVQFDKATRAQFAKFAGINWGREDSIHPTIFTLSGGALHFLCMRVCTSYKHHNLYSLR
jgi:hypothetical protein